MYFFRVDANEEIATGHMARCITIAEALKKRDQEIGFIVSDDVSDMMLKDTDYKVINLHTKWDNLMLELDKMKQLFNGRKDTLFIDTYSITTEYVTQLKPYVKIVCMDDLFSSYLDADVLINYNIFYDQFPYSNRYVNSDVKLLLGTKYVPLRKQFQKTVVREKNEVKKILLISGGGDKYNFLGQFLEHAKKKAFYKKFEINVVAGAMNRNINQLMMFNNDNIIVHQNVKNMAELMQKCDVAISAASTVLYECCAMQLPTMFFISSDDQINDKDYFLKNDMMICVGDIRSDGNSVFKNIDEAILNKVACGNVIDRMRYEMRQVTDGLGAERIAEAII